MQGVKLTRNSLERIKELYERGVEAQFIGFRFGIHRKYIPRLAKKFGWRRKE